MRVKISEKQKLVNLRKRNRAYKIELRLLKSEVDRWWEVRAMHGDLDSVKHMVRQIRLSVDAIVARFKIKQLSSEVERVIAAADVNALIQTVRGEFVNPGKVRRSAKRKK